LFWRSRHLVYVLGKLHGNWEQSKWEQDGANILQVISLHQAKTKRGNEH
jgi:hypothetical protein